MPPGEVNALPTHRLVTHVTSPVERIRLEGTDPTNWASHGLRKLVRGYVEAMLAHPDGFVLVLPDPEHPVERPTSFPFALAQRGRPVAAYRWNGREAELLGVADARYAERARRVLDEEARLDALGILERERGRESVVALAMNAYDEFGIHVEFVSAG